MYKFPWYPPKITISIGIWNPMDAEPSSWPHVTAWLHCAARNTPLQTWDVPSQCLKMLWNRELSSENAEEKTRKTGFGKKWLPKIDPWKVRMEARKCLWKMVFWSEKASWLPWTSVLRPTSSNLRNRWNFNPQKSSKNHSTTELVPKSRPILLNNCQALVLRRQTHFSGPWYFPNLNRKVTPETRLAGSSDQCPSDSSGLPLHPIDHKDTLHQEGIRHIRHILLLHFLHTLKINTGKLQKLQDRFHHRT